MDRGVFVVTVCSDVVVDHTVDHVKHIGAIGGRIKAASDCDRALVFAGVVGNHAAHESTLRPELLWITCVSTAAVDRDSRATTITRRAVAPDRAAVENRERVVVIGEKAAAEATVSGVGENVVLDQAIDEDRIGLITANTGAIVVGFVVGDVATLEDTIV